MSENSKIPIILAGFDDTDEEAKKWKTRLDKECCEFEVDWRDEDTGQEDLIDTLNRLLLNRDYPAIVLLSDTDVQSVVKSEIYRWIGRDGYLYLIAPDATILREHRIERSYSFDADARAILKDAATYTKTSLLKGFSSRCRSTRKRILLYSQPPAEGKARSPVLILGPSRSGKQVVAEALVKNARIGAGRLQTVGCGEIASELLQDALFGHWKGAFTGADQDAPGYLEICSKGAVVLNDFDSAKEPTRLQETLLQFLDDNPPLLRRLGFPRKKQLACSECWKSQENRDCAECLQLEWSRRVYTWILFTSNRLPRDMIDAGTLRGDFLNRLTRTISLTGFNERRNDIPQIASLFVRKMGVPSLDLDALRWLRDRKFRSGEHEGKDYSWPGNAGELAALLDQASLLRNSNPGMTWSDAFESASASGESEFHWLGQQVDPRLAERQSQRYILHDKITTVTPVKSVWELKDLLHATLQSGAEGANVWQTYGQHEEMLKALIRSAIRSEHKVTIDEFFEALVDRPTSSKGTRNPLDRHILTCLAFLVLHPEHEASIEDLEKYLPVTEQQTRNSANFLAEKIAYVEKREVDTPIVYALDCRVLDVSDKG